ncbi:MAG: hypothetical protein OEX22_06060 [Cyclobacteriaceae bacterium]|nr:hypothetical protein [Cyclobacteriaceae bacterium]
MKLFQQGWSSRHLIISIISSVIIFIIDLALPLGVAVGVPYISSVLTVLRSKKINNTIYIATICSILTIIGYFYSPDGGELWKVLSNRFLALFAIWVTTILSIKIIKDAQKEIKVLRGFLTTCSSCKKIKDTEGSWTKMESYINKHSEAKFSHGMCPDCFKEFYPDLEYKGFQN